jgi:hypothetical protein
MDELLRRVLRRAILEPAFLNRIEEADITGQLRGRAVRPAVKPIQRFSEFNALGAAISGELRELFRLAIRA